MRRISLLLYILIYAKINTFHIKLAHTFPTNRGRYNRDPTGPRGPKGNQGERGPRGYPGLPGGTVGGYQSSSESWCGITRITNANFTYDGESSSKRDRTLVIDLPGWYMLCETIYYEGSLNNETAISVQADNVTIDLNNLSLITTFTTPTKGIVVEPGCAHFKLRGNGAISGFKTYGIQINGTTSNHITDVDISDITTFNINQTSGATGIYATYCDKIKILDTAIYSNKRGIDFKNCTEINVKSSTITKNSTAGGMAISDSSFITIDTSTFSNNEYDSGNHYELYIENSNGINITDCLFSNNITSLSNNIYPLYIKGSNGAIIQGNSFTHAIDNNGSSVYLDTITKGMISSNTFLRSSSSGTAYAIELAASSKVAIFSNQISHYDTAIVGIQSPVTTSIYDNKFLYNSNICNAFSGNNASFIEATGNPNNLTGITESKPYQNIIIKEDKSS